MISIKIRCYCGQKFAFDVEPVDRRMPQPIECPVCGRDNTRVANDEIWSRTAKPSAPVGKEMRTAKASPAVKKENSTKPMVIGLCAVLGLLGIGGASWFWSEQHRPSPVRPAPKPPTVVKVQHDPKFVGIGAALDRDLKTRHIEITRISSNSPAAKAGLVVGHILTKINDVPVQERPLKEVATSLFGPPGTTIRLELIDPKTGYPDQYEVIREARRK